MVAWQTKCSQELSRCIAIGGVLGRDAWKQRRTELTNESIQLGHEHPRVVIADLPLTSTNLNGWCFDQCYIARCDFTDADLRNSSFDRSILRQCRLVRANLRGTKFCRTSIDEKSLGWHAKIDRRSQLAFTGALDAVSGFDPHFRRRVEEDQRIFDILTSHNHRYMKAWYSAIDYGRSVNRVACLIFCFSLFFGTLHWMIAKNIPGAFTGGETDFFKLWVMASQRTLNAQPSIDSALLGVQLLFVAEATVGFAGLALLSAVLLRKLTVLE